MSETKFDQPNNYFNPNHNNIVTIDNKYLYMENAYYGNGGFKDGSYLFCYDRESFYEQRKTMSFYRNFVRPIINSTVDPVFAQPINRSSDNKLYNSFMNNIDGISNIDEFTKDVAIYSRMYGNVFVVMDNFPETEIPLLEQEAIDQRKYPFCYVNKPYQVHDYKKDRLNQLIYITFKNNIIIDNKKLQEYVTWDRDMCIIEIKDGDKHISTTSTPHYLGVVPVIQVNSVNKLDVLPTPEFYDIARVNLAVYNKDSEIRDNERSQAFGILYLQGDFSNNMSVGPKNALVLPPSTQNTSINITPGYASPDNAILTVLLESNKDLIDTMMRMVESNDIAGIREASSGIAEAYRFMSKNTQLKKTAMLCKEFENKLMSLFGKYVKNNITGTAEYVMNYTPQEKVI